MAKGTCEGSNVGRGRGLGFGGEIKKEGVLSEKEEVVCSSMRK